MPVARVISAVRAGGNLAAGFRAVSATYGAVFLAETVVSLVRGDMSEKPLLSRIALVGLKILARDARVMIGGAALEQGFFAIVGGGNPPAEPFPPPIGDDDWHDGLLGRVVPMWQRDP